MNDFRATVQKKLAGGVSNSAFTKPGAAPATGLATGSSVRVKTSAVAYYPAGPDIPPLMKTLTYTVGKLKDINGAACAQLIPTELWCSVSQLAAV
jgi:hypothetical protein